MAGLRDLIKRIEDPVLRERITAEANKLLESKKFGLVFEEHVPECTPLYGVPIRKGSRVAKKTGDIGDIYVVKEIDKERALCENRKTHKQETIELKDVVSVAEFGEPIYPSLKRFKSISKSKDSTLWHTLIEADNYHALQLLNYVCRKSVDCIYIDPPYNSEATDWKYNNNYVDKNDNYRHSKWLSMMDKRLRLAKELLTDNGVLIIAIDDYEMAHLKVLLESLYRGYDIFTIVVNQHPQGGIEKNIGRTHEYALFLTKTGQTNIKGTKIENFGSEEISLKRGGTAKNNLRKGAPNNFYAIYVDKKTREVKGIGPFLGKYDKYDINEAPDGCRAFYPIGEDGTERVWRYSWFSIMPRIECGDIVCTPRWAMKVVKHRDVKYKRVFSLWADKRYNAGRYGTDFLYTLFAKDSRFPYAKSLYTVRDCIKVATQDKPNALILDFFAGSGTTLHAVNLLNAEDGGHRRCIMVTNNELSKDEASSLKKKGLHPGDPDWDKCGIAEYVTWERTVHCIEGTDVNGDPLPLYRPKTKKNRKKGDEDTDEEEDEDALEGTDEEEDEDALEGTDEEEDNEDKEWRYLGSGLLVRDGLEANVIYFKLGFLDKNLVELDRQFAELLPILWMKAGSIGECPAPQSGLVQSFPENHFAVLHEDEGGGFCRANREKLRLEIAKHPEIKMLYVVTDSDNAFNTVAKEFGDLTPCHLYKDYLENFKINTERLS